MSDVIKFEFDQPVEVALRYAEPRVFPPSDRFPGAEERHMFSTTDGRVMYVTPLTSARIKALHLAQGECFFVCKRKNGRLTEYSVTREPMASRPVPTNGFSHKKALPPVKSNLPERLYYSPNDLPGEPEPPSELENKLADSIALVERRKVGLQGDGTLAVMAPPHLGNTSATPRPQSGNTSATVRPAAAERMAPAVAEFSERLVLETTALVDCYASVLRAASEKHGNSIKPEDVRSLLVTAYINASKQGGRNAA